MNPVKLAPPQQAGTPPPSLPTGGALLPPQNPAMDLKKPKKGGIALGIVAAIQQIYVKEEQKQEQIAQNMGQNMSLKPGWGGQGK